MKKRLLAALVSGALMMSALAGCGGSAAQTNNGGDTADQTTQQDYHIKVILKTLASEYWQYGRQRVQAAGEDPGVTVDVWAQSSETAYDEQLSMIETTLSANDCDAMVIAPLQAENRCNTGLPNTDLPIVAIDTAIDSDQGAQALSVSITRSWPQWAARLLLRRQRIRAGIRLPPSASWVCRATPPRRHALQALSRALPRLAASISLPRRSTQTA